MDTHKFRQPGNANSLLVINDSIDWYPAPQGAITERHCAARHEVIFRRNAASLDKYDTCAASVSWPCSYAKAGALTSSW